MLDLQLLFSKNFFYLVNFSRVAMGAKNTINSSLRSKNFWISIFFSMRHLILLLEPHKKDELIWAKNSREIAVFS